MSTDVNYIFEGHTDRIRVSAMPFMLSLFKYTNKQKETERNKYGAFSLLPFRDNYNLFRTALSDWSVPDQTYFLSFSDGLCWVILHHMQ